METKQIDTTLHNFQYIGSRIGLLVVIGFLIYSIWIQRTSAIIFMSLFLIYILFLIKKVFNKPSKISFDKNFIYFDDKTEGIEFKDITSIKHNRIYYQSNGKELKVKLPNFYFRDKNWKELKELIANNT